MPFYRAVMSLHWFEQLCRFIRFDDSRTRTERLRYHKLAPIRNALTIFLANLTIPFVPGEVYLGAQPNEQRSLGIARNLVMRLSNQYLDRGVNITMDNFFTSYELADDLLVRNTTLVGTIRGNKPQLPKLFTSSEEAKKGVYLNLCFVFQNQCN
ncbi:uncharacterized protein LOC120780274 [Bactrocera tryoni]|uniref:uncharacterized protein LOC120780274 n=1 Tax=Bactrocera tryoni TaxID=59916 RepID=UPI001A96982A|nr:uncharacterized protein LOC120780274 [Bactrocera tryoni]